ncbi:5-methyltetrahydropteroyltriglutamate--homocysteine S-methyltransferase [Acinetobacter johnsonii]|uniref:5-methyltetrahydropteroyltriglutamate-- homocysteine S-methyltransferase n=1 Tax=Acinetobacter johnsonii TaxID=40214 RepID=UPI003984E5A3
MKSNTTPQAKAEYAHNKVEHIGSFLRALKLKKARYDFADRVIYEETLRQVEDIEIDNLIDIQLDLDCSVMTDGDFRRAWWHFDFLEQLNGIEGYKTRDGLKYKNAITKPYDIRITDEISWSDEHTCLAHYRYLHHAIEGFATAKYCIPSPSMLLFPHLRSNRVYANQLKDYVTDVAQSYRNAIQALYAEGCRYIQLNDEFWAYLSDAGQREKEIQQGISPETLAMYAVEIINLVLEDKPEDLFISLHIDRGNFSSSWLYEGGYDFVSDFIFKKLNNIDRYLLEFDTARAGGFECIAQLQNTKKEVFLGLISSKTEYVESELEITQRIQEASQFLPLAQLGLCLQSGFASTEEGNKVSYDTQWVKIKLMNTVAKKFWS